MIIRDVNRNPEIQFENQKLVLFLWQAAFEFDDVTLWQPQLH